MDLTDVNPIARLEAILKHEADEADRKLEETIGRIGEELRSRNAFSGPKPIRLIREEYEKDIECRCDTLLSTMEQVLRDKLWRDAGLADTSFCIKRSFAGFPIISICPTRKGSASTLNRSFPILTPSCNVFLLVCLLLPARHENVSIVRRGSDATVRTQMSSTSRYSCDLFWINRNTCLSC